ncbi:MAG: hypothetical protein VB092_09920 [Oscillospiraceae bacterium]|nr:hypothetical protein [Oscillospiraceae bacterium]
MKIGRFAERAFGALFFCAFAAAFVLCLTYGSWLLEKKLDPVLGIASGVLFTAIAYFAVKMARRLSVPNPRRVEVLLLILLFLIYIPLQLWFAHEFEYDLTNGWDFDIVVKSAQSYALEGATGCAAYYSSWPNNVPIMVLLCLLFKGALRLGITDLMAVGAVVNCVSIDVALLLVYFTARKLAGRRAAALCLAGGMLTAALLIYTSLFYTDTLSLPYPIAALYAWICFKEKYAAGKKAGAARALIAASLWIAAGSLLKITVLIAAVAIAIDALLCFGARRGAVTAAAVAILCAAFYFPLRAAAFSHPAVPEKDEAAYLPTLHYVMMGLHGNGNYYDPDYGLTFSVPADERDALVKQEIKSRVEAYGFGGIAAHLAEKIGFTWGDSLYTAPYKIGRDRQPTSQLDVLFLYYSPYYRYTSYVCEGPHLLLLSMLAAAGILFMRGKRRELLPFALSGYGLFFFLLFWETRARYLVNFLPIYLLVGILTFWYLTEKKDIAKIK